MAAAAPRCGERRRPEAGVLRLLALLLLAGAAGAGQLSKWRVPVPMVSARRAAGARPGLSAASRLRLVPGPSAAGGEEAAAGGRGGGPVVEASRGLAPGHLSCAQGAAAAGEASSAALLPCPSENTGSSSSIWRLTRVYPAVGGSGGCLLGDS